MRPNPESRIEMQTPANSIPYDPLSKLPGLGAELRSRLDRNEFPTRIDRRLAEAIETLEGQHSLTLIVYSTRVSQDETQLCRYLSAAEVGAEVAVNLRQLENDFGVWLVAYTCDAQIRAPVHLER